VVVIEWPTSIAKAEYGETSWREKAMDISRRRPTSDGAIVFLCTGIWRAIFAPTQAAKGVPRKIYKLIAEIA
jgi:hypothetical protein